MHIVLGLFCLATFLGEKESVDIRGTLLPSSGSKNKTEKTKQLEKLRKQGKAIHKYVPEI